LKIPACPLARTALAIALAAALSPAAAQSTVQQTVSSKDDAAKTPDKIQKVEVKAAAADYDPRRDDTASKTVLNAEEIRKYGDDNIYDVLKRAPGVTVTGKTIRMRGLGAGYTQILVNGDRPPPGFSFDALTPDQIERIEIIRAATAEFSMQSIAGTINIVLKKVSAKPQHDLRVGAMHAHDGDNMNAGGTWADKVGHLSYFLNGTLFGGSNHYQSWSADRFTLPDGELAQSRERHTSGGGQYRGIFLYPRLAWKSEEGNELNLSTVLQAARFPNSFSSHTDDLVGTFPQPDYVDTFQATPFHQRMQKVEVNWIAKLAGGKLDLTSSAERSRNANDSVNDFYTAGRTLHLMRDWNDVTLGHRYSLRGKYTRSLFDGHSLATGIDTSVQTSDETRDRHEQLGSAAPTDTLETFSPTIKRLAGWAQDEWSIDKQLSVYLGARWEAVQTDSEASDVPDTHSRSHVLSPVAQTLYKIPGGSGRQLRLAYSRTYKAPEVNQLTARRYEAPLNTRFNPDYSGNPDLRPELANGIDLTYEHFLPEGAMFSASASRRAITDTIHDRLELDDSGRWLHHPINEGDALVHSLQLELKLPAKLLAKSLNGLDLRGSYSRNWSRVSSVPGPDNRLDNQVPASATVGADYRKGDLTAGASLAWQQGGWVRTSETEYQDQQSRRMLDAYVLWKLDAHYQLRFSGSNLLGVDTANDQYYQDASGTSRTQSFQQGWRRFGVSLEMKL
jgi:outer membrane receptor protein involved in Fe transport